MLENELLIEVEYILGNKLLTTVWSLSMPPFEKGKFVILGRIPTEYQKGRRPAQDYHEEVYFVTDIVPKVLEHQKQPGRFYHHVEVYLRKPTGDDEIVINKE
jgi:hypothetical protein